MPDKRHNSRSKSNANQQDNNAAPPPRMKPQQWLLLGASALGVGAAFFRWSANARREQQRQQQLSASDQRELAMIPLPTRPEPLVATADVAAASAPPLLEMSVALEAGLSAALAVLPSPASPSPAADVPGSGLSVAPAPNTQDGADLPGTVATRKRKAAGAATAQTTETTDAGPKTAKTTRTASKSEAPSASAVATGKKKMSSTTGKRSKMSEEFDQALEENTVEGPGSRGSAAQSAAANMSAGASSPAAPGVPSAAPAENALATQAEGKLAVGEELRDREFPVPPQDTGAISQRLVVDQETLSDGTPRMGGAVGTMPGDRQSDGDINDIVDQRAVTPDLQAQKG